MVSRYTFSEYSPGWPVEFDAEAQQLRALLNGLVTEIHHIGSTSVPGLPAKPVIDVLPVVATINGVDECTSSFERGGYRAWGEYGIAGRRFFTKDRDGVRTHNIHIFAAGDPAIERHRAFCAYLKCHRQVCQEYAKLKREAFARFPADIAGYCDYKDAWIKRVEPLAVAWYRDNESEVLACFEPVRM